MATTLPHAKGRFSWRPPTAPADAEEHLLPLPREPRLIAILAVMFAVFCMPYFTIGAGFDGAADSVFELGAALFTAFWLLGWSTGVACLGLLLLGSLFARERITVWPGGCAVRIELFCIGVSQTFEGASLPLRPLAAEPKGGHAWRGEHLGFETQERLVRFGSRLDGDAARRLADAMRRVLTRPSFGRPAAARDVRVAPHRANAGRPDPYARSGAAPLTDVQGSADTAGAGAASLAMLVVANAVPLAGVLLFDWSVGEVMLLFWAESGVIGVWNIARLWMIGRWLGLGAGVLFLAHYGAFMAGHLIFIYGFFVRGVGGMEASIKDLGTDFLHLAPALAALFLSHGVSFFQNFVGRREYIGRDLRKQMVEPYGRIVVMHVTIIFGGFVSLAFQESRLAIVLMIALKVASDLRAHLKEHRTHGR